ncbi:MAG TPA: GNAT family N-acetyltransferase [Clostridiales bacterium]|nr:GNAT family N-acetyltransferase [Clostridiales bacterium]
MVTVRTATQEDIELLLRLRMDYLAADYGQISPADREQILAQLPDYFQQGLQDQSFLAVLAEREGEVVSAAFLAISRMPASPVFPTGKTGTLLNVLTYPQHRRKGYASMVVSSIIEEARKLGVSCVDLTATQEGKPLYDKLGFQVSTRPRMRLQL